MEDGEGGRVRFNHPWTLALDERRRLLGADELNEKCARVVEAGWRHRLISVRRRRERLLGIISGSCSMTRRNCLWWTGSGSAGIGAFWQ